MGRVYLGRDWAQVITIDAFFPIICQPLGFPLISITNSVRILPALLFDIKLAPLFVLSLGLTLGFCFAEEVEDSTMYTGRYLAAGLTEENGVISGWYDAEKTQAKDADDMMC